MPYGVVFTRKAAEEFERLPLDLAVVVDRHLEVVASDPAKHGRKPYFPFRPGGLMSEFKHAFDDRTCYIKLFFHFGPGEREIVVTGFVVQALES